jgi:hypothetical protein
MRSGVSVSRASPFLVVLLPPRGEMSLMINKDSHLI